jgi:hypothetical protein
MTASMRNLLVGTAAMALTAGFGGGAAYAGASFETSLSGGQNILEDASGEVVTNSTGNTPGVTAGGKLATGDVVLGIINISNNTSNGNFFGGNSGVNPLTGVYAFTVNNTAGTITLDATSISSAAALSGITFAMPSATGVNSTTFGLLYTNSSGVDIAPQGNAGGISLATFFAEATTDTTGQLVGALDQSLGTSVSVLQTGSSFTNTGVSGGATIISEIPGLTFTSNPTLPCTIAGGGLQPNTANVCISGSTDATTPAKGSEADFTLLDSTNFTVDAAIPEPTSLAILGSALLGLGWVRRRRRGA